MRNRLLADGREFPQLDAGAPEPEQREQGHDDGDRVEHAQRVAVAAAQPQPVVEPDQQMDPDDDHEQRLPDHRHRARPDARNDGVIRRIRFQQGVGDARAEDVRNQQQRHRQPEDQLGELPRRHPQRLAYPQRVEAEQRVDDQRAVEHHRARHALPDRRQHFQQPVLGVDRDDAERVVEEMRRDVDGEYEARDVAEHPDDAAGRRPTAWSGWSVSGAHRADCRLSYGRRAIGARLSAAKTQRGAPRTSRCMWVRTAPGNGAAGDSRQGNLVERLDNARILIYSHDSFGLGHLRRCRAIAHAIVDRFKGVSVLILSGSPIIGSFDFLPRVDFVRIPGVVKLHNGEYQSLGLHIDLDQTMAIRAAIIKQTAESFRPGSLPGRQGAARAQGRGPADAEPAEIARHDARAGPARHHGRAGAAAARVEAQEGVAGA